MNYDPISVTLVVADALSKLGVVYMIGGSLASTYHGEPRATRDADVLADMKDEHIEPFCAILGTDFYVDEESIRYALKHRTGFNIIHLHSIFKIDIFLPKRPFDNIELQRRTEAIIAHDPERRAFISTVEDVILAKLDWFRQGNEISERQWQDVTGMVKFNTGRLETDYLKSMAEELGVHDLLMRVLPPTKE